MRIRTDKETVATRLRDRFADSVVTAEDEGFDSARATFNLLIDQRPEAVARPRTDAEAAAIVAAARDAGLRVVPQGSGHNAGPLGSLEGDLVVKLDRMLGVSIDPAARVARVEAGARWWDVVPAAAEHGLTALHGSSPEINVVGYTLGGGVGWQARRHGLQTNSVTAVEIVTADGELRRIDAVTDAELFWAVRGGGGNFGLVTAVEFSLYPQSHVYAGSMFFPYERSGEVFHAWREWTQMVPDEVTSAIRMLQFPDLELVPEPVRGKSFAIVGASFLGDEEDGFEMVRPLRSLNPAMNTFAQVPASALTELHMDPVDPAPFLSAHAMLRELPAKAVDDLVAAAGPGSESVLAVAELRHLGGALSREPEGAGALAKMSGEYLMFAGAAIMAPEMAPLAEAQLALVESAMAPYDSGRYLNFTERPADVAAMFPAAALARLGRAKQTYDPDGLFRANHQIAAA